MVTISFVAVKRQDKGAGDGFSDSRMGGAGTLRGRLRRRGTAGIVGERRGRPIKAVEAIRELCDGWERGGAAAAPA